MVRKATLLLLLAMVMLPTVGCKGDVARIQAQANLHYAQADETRAEARRIEAEAEATRVATTARAEADAIRREAEAELERARAEAEAERTRAKGDAAVLHGQAAILRAEATEIRRQATLPWGVLGVSVLTVLAVTVIAFMALHHRPAVPVQEHRVLVLVPPQGQQLPRREMWKQVTAQARRALPEPKPPEVQVEVIREI